MAEYPRVVCIHLTEQDLGEWTGRLDAMVRAGGLSTVVHAAFFLGKLEAAVAAAKAKDNAESTEDWTASA